MPDSSSTMSCQDFEGNVETPDRSLGSLSLTATGEQLDDIQVNLDRMFLESPAPASLCPSGDFNGSGGDAGAALKQIGSRKSDQRDPEGFDRLSLLDEMQAFDAIDSEDWLSSPPVKLPDNFDEDDRSFLDTNLLYTRFNLLNFVTRIINEDMYAETRRHSPPSVKSNLSNEAAGSGATFRVTRPPRRGLAGAGRRISDGAEAETSYNGKAKYEATINEDSLPPNLSATSDPDKISENTSPELDRRQKYLTYRRPPIQRQREIPAYGHGPEFSQTVDLSSEENPVFRANDGGDINQMQLRFNNDRNKQSGNEASNGAMVDDQSFNSSGTKVDENGFIPDEFSPTGPAGVCKMRLQVSENTITPPTDNDTFLSRKPFVPGLRNPFDDVCANNDTYLADEGSFSHEIDTRTYTRPKKIRMSLGTPNRLLNTTMSISPIRGGSRMEQTTPQRQLNTTIDLSPVESGRPLLGSSNQLNRTIDMLSYEDENEPTESCRNLLNTTIDMSAERKHVGATLSTSKNLNETFVAEGTPTDRDRSRRVTRNLLYVVRRDEESPNNNASPQGHAHTPKSDMNNTFQYDHDGDVSSPARRGSQNTSMEDLNSRVASQIRSLGCSTISRGKIPDGIGRRESGPHLDETRLVARTSSTDTYSVAHSSESPTSSGLSSPMDAQSYNDIQSSDSVRRSMPNLAVIRGSTARSGLAYPQPGSGQLRKNHYISDSKLSRLGTNDRPRLSLHSPSSSNTATLSRGLRAPENLRTRGVDRNTSTPAALNRISSGLPTGGASRGYSAQALGSATITRPSASGRPSVSSSMGNVRSTSLAQPRYASASTSNTGSGLRPPKAVAQSSTEALRAPAAPGIPVPTFRTQSRIPGPGQLRFSRPPASKLPYRGGGAAKPSSSQKGTVDDWRDGCY